MKTSSSVTLLLAASAASACVPDLNTKASRVVQTRVVAVRATPAEATPGQQVTWQAIVVTPLVPQAATQIDWAMCLSPRNPADSITVSEACFGVPDVATGTSDAGVPSPPVVTSIPGAGGATAQGAIPSDACRKIGPEVSAIGANGAKQRPPDADITGGYQLPLRVVVSDPTLGDPRVDVSFDRQRVRCNLASAPAAAAADYAARYKPNQNPEIQSLELAGSAGPADARYVVPRGSKLPLRIRWDPAANETYVLFDPIQRAIVERTEALDVSWYTNGGEFEHDRTTRDGDQPSSSNTLQLDGSVTQSVQVWIVLRDERGGVGVATLLLDLI
ncbi:MAG: hypothetical protein JWN48_4385 [Myxococcaceae bacterium]|nr:hypothetical protein [Myxococcaceae bacterium]